MQQGMQWTCRTKTRLVWKKHIKHHPSKISWGFMLSRMENILKYTQPTLMISKGNNLAKVQEAKQANKDIVDGAYLKLVE